MKKVLLLTVVGIILLIAGLVMSLVLFEGMFNRNPMFLLISIVMIFAGMGILFFAGTRDTTSMKFKDVGLSGAGGALDKNNKMVEEWNDTNNTRDKLKVVQVVSADNSSQTS